jgi:hypothetical protein
MWNNEINTTEHRMTEDVESSVDCGVALLEEETAAMPWTATTPEMYDEEEGEDEEFEEGDFDDDEEGDIGDDEDGFEDDDEDFLDDEEEDEGADDAGESEDDDDDDL